MSVWVLEAYDTETRTARSRTYTSSKREAERFQSIPRVQFGGGNGHGIVFMATPHKGKRKPVVRHSTHVQDELIRLRKEQG